MNATPLQGKVAVVTGAAQGIGLSIAEHLLRDGATVVMVDVQSRKAQQEAERLTGNGFRASAVGCDISDPDACVLAVDSIVAEFGSVDLLVNNAGLDAPSGSAWEIDEEHWRTVVDVNLSGQWWMTQPVVKVMRSRGAGRIVFISSASARLASPDISIAYNAAKAGVVGLTVGLATHLQLDGIQVNAIAPGPTGTGRPIPAEKLAAYREQVPLGIGGPEPVAEAVLFLARPSGDWLTGAVLNVSGGWLKGW